MIRNLNKQQQQAMEILVTEIDSWVSGYLENYTPREIDAHKEVRDAVWGMTLLKPLEVAILDSPLLQRLRRIYQTGLVNLTYPTALHTRFEHSIGVLHCATLIMDSINRNEILRSKSPKFGPQDEEEIRLACLLHDIGHSALSHITEEIYDDDDKIKEAKKALEKLEPPVSPKNHELISAIIIMTPSFRSVFDEILKRNRKNLIDKTSIDRIADMIIGRPVDGDLRKTYITDVINGSYDADRLDYVFRDSYFTGLAFGTDVHKFISGLSVEEVAATGKTSIVLHYKSISAYHRLISSKMYLHSDVYNHQKVLATNMLVKNILYLLNDTSNKIQDISLNDRINFLSFTDWSFLTGHANSKEIEELQRMIARRDIPVRYVEISKQSINNEDDEIPPSILPYFAGGKEQRIELTRLLCEKCGFGFFKPKSISIEHSNLLRLGESQNAYIKNYDGTTVLYNKIIPSNMYGNEYMNKWAVYVFGSYEKLTNDVYIKASSYLQKKLGIVLNDNAKPILLERPQS